MILGLAIHILAAVIWVGGMFFAYLVLRPSAGPLEPALRLSLWQRVFARFFPVVWASILALVASGYGMDDPAFPSSLLRAVAALPKRNRRR